MIYRIDIYTPGFSEDFGDRDQAGKYASNLHEAGKTFLWEAGHQDHIGHCTELKVNKDNNSTMY